MAGGGRAAQTAGLLASLALGLGACAGNAPQKAVVTSPPVVAVAPVGATVHGEVLPDSVGPPKQEAAVDPPVPAVNVAAPRRASISQGEALKRLVGLDRAALEGTLGVPWLLRREAKAELWQYRAPNCVLDLFLYAKVDGEPRVMHADLRGRREGRPAPAGCYLDIVDGQTQKAEALKPSS